MAKSMVLTDHYLSEEDLGQIGARIADGKAVVYPQETIDAYIQMFDEEPDIERRAGRFIYGCFGVVVALMLAIAGFIYWWTG